MNMTPIAQSLAAQGRNGDSMLVHMTPNEVGGLQALAQSAGGSLSINPTTGMPEANFLQSILPMIIGAGITFATGGAASPLLIGAGVGGGTALLTGDLNKGLMAGLGAFGGAGIGTTLAGMGGLTPAAAAGTATAQQAATLIPPSGMSAAAGIGGTTPYATSIGQSLSSGAKAAMANPGAFGSQLVSNLGGPLGAGAAGLGALGSFGAFDQPQTTLPTTSADSTYEGPYMPVEREVRYPDADRTSTSEFNYFNPSNPTPGYQTFADGGEIDFNLQPVPVPVPEPVQEAKPEEDPTTRMLVDFMLPGFREAFGGEPYIDPEERARIKQVLESEGYTKGGGGGSGGSGGSTVVMNTPTQTSGGAFGGAIEKIKKAVSDASGRRRPSSPPPVGIDSKYGFQPFAQGGMAGGFQTFGGEQATDNMYAFNPDNRQFRNEAERTRILGRQVGAGIPLNISGIDEQGKPIYETSYNIPNITEDDISTLEQLYVQPPPPLPLPFDPPGLFPIENIRRMPPNNNFGGDGGGYDDIFGGFNDMGTGYDYGDDGIGFDDTPTGYDYGDDGIGFGGDDGGDGGSSDDAGQGGEDVAAGGLIKKAPGGLASIAGGEFMEDGSFVIDARTVAELGNGSSNAGLELLMQLGGRPVEGPGDGVSDSIPATIDGTRDAAVARDEVIFDPQAVAAIGKGDAKRGAEYLYEMMRQAEKARKEVDRGEDSGAGLKALSMAGAV